MLDILKDEEGSDAHDGMFSLLMFFLFFINFFIVRYSEIYEWRW